MVFMPCLQVYVIDAACPLDGLQCVRTRVAGVQYFLEHHHDFFYVLTNASSEGIGFFATGDYHLARFRDVNLPAAGWQVSFIFLEILRIPFVVCACTCFLNATCSYCKL